jgi:hypothetical protein
LLVVVVVVVAIVVIVERFKIVSLSSSSRPLTAEIFPPATREAAEMMGDGIVVEGKTNVGRATSQNKRSTTIIQHRTPSVY